MVSYRFGAYRLKDGESLWLDGALIPLSPLQLRLLTLFCRLPQQVISRQTIVQEAWGHEGVSDISLARAIHGLRSRLGAESNSRDLIRNIYGRGYILTIPVIQENGDHRPQGLSESASH